MKNAASPPIKTSPVDAPPSHLLKPLSPELLDLWKKTVWGTERTLYQIPDADSFTHYPEAARFGELRIENYFCGGLFLLPKIIQHKHIRFQACYQGLMAIDRENQGKGYGRALLEQTNSALAKTMDPLSMLYAYIETDNIRSLNLFRSFGYTEIGNCFVNAFSRFQPSDSPRAGKLRSDQKTDMVNQLTELYKNHLLVDIEASLQPENYYVLREGERIVAGLQVESQRWIILSLEGAGGWLARKLLPYIPFLRDLFNPKDFRFLKFSNIYVDSDQPHLAAELMEAILARHRRNTALMFWDERSPVFKNWAGATWLGLLNPLVRTEVKVMARPSGIAAEDFQQFQNCPIAISPNDP